MVSVPVAQDQRVHPADPGQVGQKAWRRPFAEVEHEPPAARFEEEAGRALGTDAGNEPQRARTRVHS